MAVLLQVLEVAQPHIADQEQHAQKAELDRINSFVLGKGRFATHQKGWHGCQNRQVRSNLAQVKKFTCIHCNIKMKQEITNKHFKKNEFLETYLSFWNWM